MCVNAHTHAFVFVDHMRAIKKSMKCYYKVYIYRIDYCRPGHIRILFLTTVNLYLNLIDFEIINATGYSQLQHLIQ